MGKHRMLMEAKQYAAVCAIVEEAMGCRGFSKIEEKTVDKQKQIELGLEPFFGWE
jgi:hypothetical protein